MRVATVDRAVTAFKTCGIVPIDSQIFTEDFLPSEVTDQPLLPDYDETENEPLINLQTVNKNVALIHTEEILQENPEEIGLHVNEIGRSVTSYDISLQQPSTSTGLQGTGPEFRLMTLDDSSDDDCNPTRPNTPPAAPSYNPVSVVHVSPAEIHPIPKCSKRKRRRGGKSTVLTGTPNKKMLEDRANKKLNTEVMKARKSLVMSKKDSRDSSRKDKKISLPAPNNKEEFSRNKKETLCPVCNVKYCDPPGEDWIQCSQCLSWWHELCLSLIHI